MPLLVRLLFAIEWLVFPSVDADWGRGGLASMMLHGFRIPGGVLLLGMLLPVLGRWFALPSGRFSDTVAPALALAIGVARIGCFLNGWCFGSPTTLGLGVAFPPGAEIYAWQLRHGLIPPFSAWTLAVHPVQLYFSGYAFVLFLLSCHWLRRSHADGEVWRWFFVLFFAGTLALELVRPTPSPLNLIVSGGVIAWALLPRLLRWSIGRTSRMDRPPLAGGRRGQKPA